MTSQPISSSKDVRHYQAITNKLNAEFPRELDKRDFALDLMEEVGELTQAILIVEKRKFSSDPAKKRSVDDIANALGDILWDVLMLANKYNLDLQTEYDQVLAELEERNSSGEFEGETL